MPTEASLPSTAVPAPAVSRPWRGLLFTSVLCIAIAVVLTVLDRGGFGTKLVYSFAIGLSCWAVIDGMRIAVNGLVRRARRRRGETPDGPDFLVGWRGMLPLALLAMLFGPPLGLTVGDALTGGRSTSLLQFGATSTRLTLAFSIIGTLASVFVVSTLERLAAARASAERAQRVAAEAQLRLLQSQLEPHMLFNTLANLRVLIGVDAARAQAMLDHLNAFLQRGFCHSLQREYDLAVVDFTSVIQRKPDHLWAYTNRGSAYGKLGKNNLAMADFDKVLQLDPKNEEAYNNRGWIKKAEGDTKGACKDWNTSKKMGNAEAKIILKNNNCR